MSLCMRNHPITASYIYICMYIYIYTYLYIYIYVYCRKGGKIMAKANEVRSDSKQQLESPPAVPKP